jgi:hypothetical protein
MALQAAAVVLSCSSNGADGKQIAVLASMRTTVCVLAGRAGGAMPMSVRRMALGPSALKRGR